MRFRGDILLKSDSGLYAHAYTTEGNPDFGRFLLRCNLSAKEFMENEMRRLLLSTLMRSRRGCSICTIEMPTLSPENRRAWARALHHQDDCRTPGQDHHDRVGSGAGSTFRFHLPVLESESSAPTGAEVSQLTGT